MEARLIPQSIVVVPMMVVAVYSGSGRKSQLDVLLSFFTLFELLNFVILVWVRVLIVESPFFSAVRDAGCLLRQRRRGRLGALVGLFTSSRLA